MTKENRNIERPHVVDGIKEYDNPLPSWWLGLFIATIVFSPLYLFYTHALDGHLLEDELAEDRKAHEDYLASLAADQKSSGPGLSERLAQASMIGEGKLIYTTNCAPCHGDQGQGVVGPNLTDQYWLHGGSAEDIIAVITNGVPEKGMISWQSILGTGKIEQVTAFILSLKGTEPPNPKAPQGELYESESR